MRCVLCSLIDQTCFQEMLRQGDGSRDASGERRNGIALRWYKGRLCAGELMTSLSVTWRTNELAGHHAEVWAGMRKSRDRWSMSGMRAPCIQQMEWRTSLPETVTFLPSTPRGAHVCKWLPSFSLYVHLRHFLKFAVKDCLVVGQSQLSSIPLASVSPSMKRRKL